MSTALPLPTPISFVNRSVSLSDLQAGTSTGHVITWNGTTWESVDPSTSIGNISGPETSTNQALAVWSGTAGDTLIDSALTFDGITLNMGATSLSGLLPGGVESPSLSFNGSATTGIYSGAANTLSIAINGANAFTVGTDKLLSTGLTAEGYSNLVRTDSSNKALTNKQYVLGLQAINEDGVFRIGNTADPTKKMSFDIGAAGVSNTTLNFLVPNSDGFLTAKPNSTSIAVGTVNYDITGAGNTVYGIGSSVTSYGTNNVVVGYNASRYNTSGNNNVIVGANAVLEMKNSSDNIVIGANSGSSIVSGHNNNIIIGSGIAASAVSNAIVVGNASAASCTITGISGSTSASGVAVLVNASGVLGTTTSSARYKDDVLAVTGSKTADVFRLNPVSFYYKTDVDKEYLNYGLIAEEVEEVMPELVQYKMVDGVKVVETVYYQYLAPLILSAVKELKTTYDAEIVELKREIAELKAR